jgi:hypothetical protein
MLARAATGPEMLFDGKEGTVREQVLDAGRLLTWTESIAPGRCLRVTVGGQGEGTGIELRAFEADGGGEIDRSEAAHAVGVRACAPADQVRNVRLEVQASAGRMEAIIGERVWARE